MLELRPLDNGDIPLVEHWLHKEHVKRWYEIPHLGVTIDDWMTEDRAVNARALWGVKQTEPLGTPWRPYAKPKNRNDEQLWGLLCGLARPCVTQAESESFKSSLTIKLHDSL